MGKTANGVVKFNPELKQNPQELFSGFGTLTTGMISIFLRQSIMEWDFPF